MAARALRLLARREHTRRELAAKLSPHCESGAELEALLDDFTARGWISEARVADQVVHARRGRFGLARIRQALVERGISREVIESAVAELKTGELAAARAVWSRKFRAAPASREERARHVRFLQSRGFSVEIATRAIDGTDYD